jgi:hypothetical protein
MAKYKLTTEQMREFVKRAIKSEAYAGFFGLTQHQEAHKRLKAKGIALDKGQQVRSLRLIDDDRDILINLLEGEGKLYWAFWHVKELDSYSNYSRDYHFRWGGHVADTEIRT